MSVDWADIKVVMFAKDEVLQHCGREHAMWTLSHRGDLDWIVGYIFGCRFNFLHVRTSSDYSLCMHTGLSVAAYVCTCVDVIRSKLSDVHTKMNFLLSVCMHSVQWNTSYRQLLFHYKYLYTQVRMEEAITSIHA